MSANALPPQRDFFYAILRHLADHPEGDVRANIHAAMPKLVGLTESQRIDLLPSGVPRYRYRSGWGLTMLKGAGYVDQPRRRTWRLTQRGHALLAHNRDGFDEAVAQLVTRRSARHKIEEAQPEAIGPRPSYEDLPNLDASERNRNWIHYVRRLK